ncbi:hypothetical protein TEA_006861 [Camellia sinensis var. sinensis]|uniref:Uncharacterized protein n=1 Tax=Camellia sinensis var. sinensis TaxID=542762 RepID=A0A4S4ELH2_CAMSN|nr:hypothetical protein TEA_006861 [Camellia sinensis var. sinensis]
MSVATRGTVGFLPLLLPLIEVCALDLWSICFDGNIIGIEREIASLQMEEKKLVAEIKKTAKTGNEASLSSFLDVTQAATRILARQLVRLRQQITNLQGSRAQIRGVATHTQALYASTSISTGMKGATKAMVAMNKIEMMSESIDETLDKDEAEEETEELTNQVLDEIGVDIASQLSSAPKGRIASKKVESVVPSTPSDTTSAEGTFSPFNPLLTSNFFWFCPRIASNILSSTAKGCKTMACVSPLLSFPCLSTSNSPPED